MSMITPTEKDHTDIIDFIADACKTRIDTKDQAGNVVSEHILNDKKVWYKTLLINSPHFGRFAKYLEDLDNMSLDVYNFMPVPRAKVLSQQIRNHVESLRYSMDAKSSETLRDKHNSQASLVHIMTKNKSERAVTIKDEAKKSFFDAFTGKQKSDTLYD